MEFTKLIGGLYMSRKILQFATVVMLATGLTLAQITTGTVSGTVRDSSGAVLPGANVNLINTDTGATRTAVADARGYYAAPNLSLGQYEITATSEGFQTTVRRGITLNVGQNAVIDFGLQIGSVSERVEVTAEAPLIQTTSATVSGLVNERQVQDLPLNARDLVSLGTLYAGVVAPTTGERSASKGFGTKLAISGTRYNQSLFQLDGVDINDAANSAGGAAGILMGAETIREFNVITNGYSAEYGRHTGGVFNAVTKSGTNSLHGSVFEFLRNEKLDANRWETNAFGGGSKDAYKRNQFGFSLGGPIARDKSFFFGSYEGLREREGETATFAVPDANARRGTVPTTAAICTSVQGTFTATTGTCSLAVHPGVRPYLESYPLPNGALQASAGTGDWADSRSVPTDENFFTIRMDHKLSDSDTLFGRYTFDDAIKNNRTNFNAYENNDSRNQYAAFGHTRIVSQALVNQLVLGYTRTFSAQKNTAVEGLTIPTFNFTTHDGAMGLITTTGLGSWGGESQYPRASVLNMFQIKDDVFYTAGQHSIKFGVNAQRFRFKYGALFNGGGTYAFGNIPTFMAGVVNSYTALTADSQGGAYPEQTVFGIHLQDDYRITPHLTMNMGLRYEVSSVPKEVYGRVSNLRDFLGINQTQNDLIIGNPVYLNPSLKNFAPRMGLAWDPTGDGKTSVRAGAGIFHDQITAGPYLFAYHSSLPYVLVGNITTGARFPDAFFTQQQQMAGAPNMEGFQYKMQQPATYKYSLDVQREVITNTSVNLGFAATRGVHLLRVLNMNARIAQDRADGLFVSTTAPFRSPAFGRLRPRFSDVSSNYYAFRMSVAHRYSNGLQFQGSYTYSKTTDDGSNWTGGSDWSNSPGQARYLNIKEKSLAAFDVRNVLSTNFTYDLPGQRMTGPVGKVFGGWQISGILSMQDGVPFTLTTGVRPGFIQNGFIGDFPDVAAGAEFKYDERNADRYFDPSPFHLPRGYVAADQTALGGSYVGNVARTNLIAPGQAKLDLVLTKSTNLSEKIALQFRSEFFNILNRANYGLPNGRVFASAAANEPLFANVGRITNTTTTARQIQFGLRLQF